MDDGHQTITFGTLGEAGSTRALAARPSGTLCGRRRAAPSVWSSLHGLPASPIFPCPAAHVQPQESRATLLSTLRRRGCRSALGAREEPLAWLPAGSAGGSRGRAPRRRRKSALGLPIRLMMPGWFAFSSPYMGAKARHE